MTRSTTRTLLAVFVLVSGSHAVKPPPAVPSPRCIQAEVSTSSLSISWTANAAAFSQYYVQLSHKPGDKPFALQTSLGNTLVFKGLSPSTDYTVSLRALPVTAPSASWGPAWRTGGGTISCRTASATSSNVTQHNNIAATRPSSGKGIKTSFMRVYRISEYSFDVDFLRNHDTASVDAMPLYLMTCDPHGTCTPWDAKIQSPRWDQCHAAMESLCPKDRGAAFNCMECADANREALLAACGNWTDADSFKGEGSFAVHWWCGVGWPESAPVQGPITEYCIEYAPLTPGSPSGGPGFSDYLSCNSDEVDGTLGNDPRDPSCICIVWDDRLLAHQSNQSFLKQDCYVGHMAWLGEKPCNCTHQLPASPLPHSGNPSLTHVGRMPVFLPYVGVEMKPYQKGQPEVPSGFNYHFPLAGACDEDQSIGDNGCTWRKFPQARMMYGADLLRAGWNTSFVPDTATDQSHTLANIRAFKRALEAHPVRPVPCGGK